MVKIKDNYVMTLRERENYEHMDALPRKAYGKVEYYYKPQTKYPPRVYVFMHAEIWQDRTAGRWACSMRCLFFPAR